jgi:hypothetical protein
MRTTTSEFDAKAEAGQNRPAEIIDFFLGSQETDDADTKHYAMYDTDIDFFDVDSNAQTYEATRISRSEASQNMNMQRDSLTLTLDNVSEEFTTKFWEQAMHLQDRRVLLRKLFTDNVGSATQMVIIMDGIVDTVSVTERSCRLEVVSFVGFIGFNPGIRLGRICPISVFANSRCAQSVSPVTLLTQETTDNVDVGSTTTSIKVKTLTQTDDYWKVGRLEFTSGANDGMVRKIIAWDQSTKTFTIDFPVKTAPSEDDTVKVLRDCNRTLDMCRTRFTEVDASIGNIANFRGFNTVPTIVNP